MKFLENSPAAFFRLLEQQKETQLLLAGIRLDVFSLLDEPQTASAAAALLHTDARNTEYFLKALTAIGVITLSAGYFSNTTETRLYLSRNSRLYLGEYFLLWEEKTRLACAEDLVRHGSGGHAAPHTFFDFHRLAELSAVEIGTGRLQSFLDACASVLQPDARVHLLDLGGGSGRMAIEFCRRYPNADGAVYEHPQVADVPRGQILSAGMADRIEVLSGDFMREDFGSGYDLIIASGILDFAGDELEQLTQRVAAATHPGGYLYVVGHHINDEETAPKTSILNWLSARLHGMSALIPRSRICCALADAGFDPQGEARQEGAIAHLQGTWYRRRA